MKKIVVVVTNDEERRRAEYVALHWQEISYSLNGIYFEIEDGDSPSFEAGTNAENNPDYVRLYNAIFRQSGDVPEKRPVGRPAEMEGGKRRNPYLSDAEWELAKRLGDGNASKGIQKALKLADMNS